MNKLSKILSCISVKKCCTNVVSIQHLYNQTIETALRSPKIWGKIAGCTNVV
jgi:hypothetical protein